MEENLYELPGYITMSGVEDIMGLNDAEFDFLLNNPTYLSVFLSNPVNLEILTPAQLNIIQGNA